MTLDDIGGLAGLISEFEGFLVPNLSELPISTETAKTHTKVEGFALMVNDLRTLCSV